MAGGKRNLIARMRLAGVAGLGAGGWLVVWLLNKGAQLWPVSFAFTAVASSVFLGWASIGAGADTIRGALTQAYQNNPQLNAQRAAVRATDETVPQALSGYRPRISLSASAGEAFMNSTSQSDLRHRRDHLSADHRP